MNSILFIVHKLKDLLFRMKKRINQKKCLFYLKKAGVLFEDIQTVQINGKCLIYIDKSANVQIGRGLIINSGSQACIDNLSFSKLNVASGATLTIGKYSGFSNTVIQCREMVKIGNCVNIGAGCLIMDSDFHSTDWKDRNDRKTDISKAKTSPVVIGDHVLIGARVIILKGVNIGSRTTIAAGSVVVKDIPEDCLAGGNPCRVIRNNKGTSD